MSQPNSIQIGQVERQKDMPKDWQLVIDNAKLKAFFEKNWINIVILALTFYIFANRNVYFSLTDTAVQNNGKAESVG